ncbi:MAG: iron-containing alcohol dehydrogenase [Dethiobacteria bacterium]|nr:iron-containing alcohol dehydrogenase [Bacillota bacterium]MDW7729385.1 iron-containing alcohol dehydrogenase [Bacillota bacterium]
MYISKFVTPEIIFGTGSLNQVGECCSRLGSSRVFLVADRGIVNCGWADKAVIFLDKAKLDYQIWSEFSANPRDYEVEEGLSLYRNSNCDAVLAIGGGSAVDAAKAVATLSTNKGRIHNYEGIDMITEPLPPLIVVPSTAGSGSEVSQFAIISDSDRKIKMTIISKSLVPDIAVSDPIILSTISGNVTAHTGMEALSHAIEAYLSLASTDMTDIHALHAIKLISENLRSSVASQVDETAKIAMAKASLHAGIAFSNAVLGLGQAMTHQVGGLLDLPIGTISAVLLPYVMRYNLIACVDKYAEIAAAMGAQIRHLSKREAAEKAIGLVQELAKDVGIPSGLAELGLPESSIPELSRNTKNDACFITNPRDADEKDIINIFRAALEMPGGGS